MARAAEAALNLIRDQQRSGLLGHTNDRRRELRRQGAHPAFTLDGLGNDGRGLVGHRGLERRDIVRRDEGHAWNERAERITVVRVRRHRQGAHGAPGEPVVERDITRAIGPALRIPVATGKFQTGLDRFGAAVTEEGALQTRERGQLRGELSLQRVIEQVGGVNQGLRLVPEHVSQPGVRMAEHDDANTGEEVEILSTVGVEQAPSFPANEHHGLPLVGLQHVPGFELPVPWVELIMTSPVFPPSAGPRWL